MTLAPGTRLGVYEVAAGELATSAEAAAGAALLLYGFVLAPRSAGGGT
jgi:hypothetical protein